jgi:hypothetical protein
VGAAGCPPPFPMGAGRDGTTSATVVRAQFERALAMTIKYKFLIYMFHSVTLLLKSRFVNRQIITRCNLNPEEA